MPDTRPVMLMPGAAAALLRVVVQLIPLNVPRSSPTVLVASDKVVSVATTAPVVATLKVWTTAPFFVRLLEKVSVTVTGVGCVSGLSMVLSQPAAVTAATATNRARRIGRNIPFTSSWFPNLRKPQDQLYQSRGELD